MGIGLASRPAPPAIVIRPFLGVHTSVNLPKHRAVKSPRLHEVVPGLATGLAEVIAEKKRVKRIVWGMLHHILTVEFQLLGEGWRGKRRLMSEMIGWS